ncbi:peptidase [Thermostilla marina]
MTERSHRRMRTNRRWGGRLCLSAIFGVAALAGLWNPDVVAEEVVLKNGWVLSGSLGQVTGLVELPKPLSEDGGDIPLIVFVDDELRRTYVAKRQILEIRPGEVNEVLERFTIPQRVKLAGPAIGSVGMPLRVTPFDEYGRRIFTMRGAKGPIDVVQGITEITPKWTRVRGLTHYWDMRMATTSIPPETLYRILTGRNDNPDVDLRKKIARFFIQMQRYEDAVKELKAILEDPTVEDEERDALRATLRSLQSLAAQRLLGELQMRRQAGQHRLVFDLLNRFPSENVGGELLQQVRQIVDEYKQQSDEGRRLVTRLEELVDEIPSTGVREELAPILAEIKQKLDFDTLPRLATFAQLVDDDTLLAEERVALAVSGWFVGANLAGRRLPVALSLYRVRELVRRYLTAEDALTRSEVLKELEGEEGATPTYVSAVLAHMEPVDAPELSEEAGGYFVVDVPETVPERANRYLVQLPPEYNPLRKYPTIVTLHGAGTTAAQQVDWWAGERTENGVRLGQAGRHGYIVVAPMWTTEHQSRYDYSLQEHLAVLHAVRDACRRFSIDTDRLFLSGHFMGGDAAWDIGLAHPSMWAGVIPVCGRSDRYCSFYWPNAKLLPFYVVMGELDGSLLKDNSRDLDRCLRTASPTIVVEYLGRGRENFSDEILRIFDWMGHQQRIAFPQEFEAVTMREWDDRFWYVQIEGLPPAVATDPALWPPRAPRTMRITGSRPSPTSNKLFVRAGASLATVWLSPELVDFEERFSLSINGRTIDSRDVSPSVATILEDVRLRGDRLHPFWAKVEVGTSR